MKKQTVYTNNDDEDFTLKIQDFLIEFKLLSGSDVFYLKSEEVDEFCELLQNSKKEMNKRK